MNWISYVTDDPTLPGANASRNLSGGGAYHYEGYLSSTGKFAAQSDDGSVLTFEPAEAAYTLDMGDGSRMVYAESDGATNYPRRIMLGEIVDPQGNALTLNYDQQFRLLSITDAIGRHTRSTAINRSGRCSLPKSLIHSAGAQVCLTM